MKRAGNLYHLITEPQNLRLAFYKAAQGKRGRYEIIHFSKDLDSNLGLLRRQLLKRRPDIGHYRFFRVRDPKPRNICAASFPERVLHHAIMNICEPVLERYAIFDSYACRKGKGTVRALQRTGFFARKSNWYLKLDIRRYFDSVDHTVMLCLLKKRFKDKPLLALFEKILATYHIMPEKGLPIGNLISQHLANYYLGYFDHWLKEELRAPCYLRYMDDFILFADTRQTAQKQLDEVRLFLDSRLKLQLKENIQMNRCGYGIPFLGFRVYPQIVKLGVQSKKRFREKFRRYEEKYLTSIWTETELIRHMEPLLGWSFAASSKSYRNHVIQKYGVLS